MPLQESSQVLVTSFQDIWNGVVNFLPSLIIAIVILLIGWLVGALLGRAVEQIVRALKVDQALRNAGVDKAMERTGYSLNAGAFLGALVKWFIIIVFLVAALDVVGLTQVNEFLRQVVLLYLPQVIVAVLILLVAAVVAEFMENLVVGSAKAANVRPARFLGTLTKWAIWIFALMAALFQLGIATTFLQTLFTGVVVALSLAFGLAFGLGGQSAASDYIDFLRNRMK
jgi:small-conductance mechanosensitive channel